MTTTTSSNAGVSLREATPEPCVSFLATTVPDSVTASSAITRPIMCPPPPPTWSSTKEDVSFVLDEPYILPMHSNSSNFNLLEEDDEDDYDTIDSDGTYSPASSPGSSIPPVLMDRHEGHVLEQLMGTIEENRQFEARRMRKKTLEHWELAFPLVKDAARTVEMRDALTFFRLCIKQGSFYPSTVTAFDVEVAAFAGRAGGQLREILSPNVPTQPLSVLNSLVGRLTGKRKRRSESESLVDGKRRRLVLDELVVKMATKAEAPYSPDAPIPVMPFDFTIPPTDCKIPPSGSTRLLERAWRPVAGCARVAKALGGLFVKTTRGTSSLPIFDQSKPSIVTREVVQWVRAQLLDLTDDMERRFAFRYWAELTRIARESLQAKADLEYIERGRSPAVKRGITAEPRRPSMGPASAVPRRV